MFFLLSCSISNLYCADSVEYKARKYGGSRSLYRSSRLRRIGPNFATDRFETSARITSIFPWQNERERNRHNQNKNTKKTKKTKKRKQKKEPTNN